MASIPSFMVQVSHQGKLAGGISMWIFGILALENLVIGGS